MTIEILRDKRRGLEARLDAAGDRIERLRGERNRLRDERKRLHGERKRLSGKAALATFRANQVEGELKISQEALRTPLAVLAWARQKRKREAGLREARQRLEASGLFDPDWYVACHPAAADDPIGHYLESGVYEAADPHPLFDTDWYIAQNLKALGDGCNPLLHYLDEGVKQALSPHPLFDGAWYVQRYPEVAKQGVNPLLHYLREGAVRGCEPNPRFDSRWYRARAGDLAPEVNPLVHYVTEGQRRGLSTRSPPARATKHSGRANS